jgi:hypothetical protein
MRRRGRGRLGARLDRRFERGRRLEVEEGADSWARTVSDRGRGGGARQRPPAGLGRGPEKERGEEGMGRPGIGLAGRIRGKVKAGKEFVFLFQI